MIDKFTSIKTVISKIYRDLNINYEISEESMIEWAAEALSIIGAFSQFEEITTYLELDHGKASLPCNFEKLVDVNYCGKRLYWSTNTNRHNFECSGCKIPDCCGDNEDTFYINNSYFISNVCIEGNKKIELTYLGIPLDDEGYPLIPDNVYYIKAIAAYIIFMLDSQEWRKGRLPDKVYEKSNQDWLFYVNSARGAANMPNIAQLENLKNVYRRLLPITNDYRTGFRNFNRKERLNRK